MLIKKKKTSCFRSAVVIYLSVKTSLRCHLVNTVTFHDPLVTVIDGVLL